MIYDLFPPKLPTVMIFLTDCSEKVRMRNFRARVQRLVAAVNQWLANSIQPYFPRLHQTIHYFILFLYHIIVDIVEQNLRSSDNGRRCKNGMSNEHLADLPWRCACLL